MGIRLEVALGVAFAVTLGVAFDVALALDLNVFAVVFDLALGVPFEALFCVALFGTNLEGTRGEGLGALFGRFGSAGLISMIDLRFFGCAFALEAVLGGAGVDARWVGVLVAGLETVSVLLTGEAVCLLFF